MQWAGAPARDPPGRQPRSVGQKIRYNCNDLLRISLQTTLADEAVKLGYRDFQAEQKTLLLAREKRLRITVEYFGDDSDPLPLRDDATFRS